MVNVWHLFVKVLAIASNKKNRLKISADTMAQRWIFPPAECIEDISQYLRSHEYSFSDCTSMAGQILAWGFRNKGLTENLDTPLLWWLFYGQFLLNRFTLCCDQDFITHNFVPCLEKCQVLSAMMRSVLVPFSPSTFQQMKTTFWTGNLSCLMQTFRLADCTCLCCDNANKSSPGETGGEVDLRN